MKKLLVIILAVALILPAAALMEERDPIIGAWYMFVDTTLYPEIKGAYNNNDFIYDVYFFTAEGSIYMLDMNMKGSDSNATVTVAGRWQKSNDKYIASIVGIGENELMLEGDTIILDLSNIINQQGIRTGARMYRTITFNPYQDIIYNFK